MRNQTRAPLRHPRHPRCHTPPRSTRSASPFFAPKNPSTPNAHECVPSGNATKPTVPFWTRSLKASAPAMQLGSKKHKPRKPPRNTPFRGARSIPCRTPFSLRRRRAPGRSRNVSGARCNKKTNNKQKDEKK